MKLLVILLAFATFANAKSSDDILYSNTASGYFTRFGIPEAQRIKKAEEQYLNSRIVGGVPATLGQYPHQVGLITDIIDIDDRGICGGSLITRSRVLTAAHCWNDGTHQAWRYEVVLGSILLFSGGTRIYTSAIATHPLWIPTIARNNIAVIYLPTAVSLSANINTIPLPSEADIEEDFVGERAIASGFGLTRDDGSILQNQFLSHVALKVISNSACSSAFPLIIQDSNICTSSVGGISTCLGDLGGPLMINRNGRNILIGVSSFVSSFGCEVGFPAVFTKVAYFLNFIKRHT